MRICFDQMSGTGCGKSNRDTDTKCQFCGRSLRYALDLLDAGTRLQGYEIRRMIGHGSFGAVYEATNLNPPPAVVAIKETLNSDHIEQFRGEFNVLYRLQHTNLPRYIQMFVLDDRGYLVMEFVEGKSLQEILEEEQHALLENQVLGYALQLCDLLIYLHDQQPPILHRDIKPANIRFTPHGVAKLVDFGLMKSGTDTTRLSRRGLTTAYAPLEQYGSGQGARTDPRTDIYSLGATLYHLLTFQIPFPVTERIASSPDPQPSPRYHNPHLSQNLAQAIARAMAIRPEDRFESAAQFRQALVSAFAETTAPGLGTTIIPDRKTVQLYACPACRTPYDKEEIYCQECGFQVSTDQKNCHVCGILNSQNNRFCVGCGAPFNL